MNAEVQIEGCQRLEIGQFPRNKHCVPRNVPERKSILKSVIPQVRCVKHMKCRKYHSQSRSIVILFHQSVVLWFHTLLCKVLSSFQSRLLSLIMIATPFSAANHTFLWRNFYSPLLLLIACPTLHKNAKLNCTVDSKLPIFTFSMWQIMTIICLPLFTQSYSLPNSKIL